MRPRTAKQIHPAFEPLEGRLPPAGFGPTFGERVADAAPTKEILTDTPLTGQEFGQTIAEGAQLHRGGPNQPTP